MVNKETVRIIICDKKRIFDIINEYIVDQSDNISNVCSSKRMTSTWINLSLKESKMLCIFSHHYNKYVINEMNRSKLLEIFPHTGYQYFELTNRQVQELLSGDKSLSIDELNIVSKKDRLENLKKDIVRFLILNETEMKEILYKQICDFAIHFIDFSFNNISIGMQVNFDGQDSKLVFYYYNRLNDFDFDKIDIEKINTKFSNLGYDYKYIDINSNELKQFMKD